MSRKESGGGWLNAVVSWKEANEKGDSRHSSAISVPDRSVSLEQAFSEDVAVSEKAQSATIEAATPFPDTIENKQNAELIDLAQVQSVKALKEYINQEAIKNGGYYKAPLLRGGFYDFEPDILTDHIDAISAGHEKLYSFPPIPGIKEKLEELIAAPVQTQNELPVSEGKISEQVIGSIEGGVATTTEYVATPEKSQETTPLSFENIYDYTHLDEYLDAVGAIQRYSPSYIKMAVRAYRKGDLALGGVPNIPGLHTLLGRLGSDPEQLAKEDEERKRLVEAALINVTSSRARVEEEVVKGGQSTEPNREDVLKAFGRTDVENWADPVAENMVSPSESVNKTSQPEFATNSEEVRRAFSSPVVHAEKELAEADQYFKGQGIDLRDSEQHSESAPLVPFEDATQNIEAEVTVERIKTIEEVKEEELAQAFAERFSIAREELDAIPGFNDLALAQKHLVLQNLAESTVNRIEETAAEQYRTDLATERGSKTLFGSALLGNVWISIRESLTKGKHVLEREQTQAAALRAGGIGAHGEVLTQLVRGMREMGPRANFREDGELVVEYAGEWNGISEEGKRTLALFNEIAHDYAKQTYEDGIARSRRALRAEREGYEGYERQKRYLMSIMEREGVPPAEILTKMAETDAQITMSQFVQSKEDAMKTLATIEDRKIWDEVVRSIATERGIYAASGYVARSAITGLFGIFAAPVVASGVGFIRSWKRADAEVRERDRAQRRGAIVRGETAQNMVFASGERGAVAKMHHLLARINMLDEQLAGVGEQVDTQETPAVDREQLLEKRRALFLSLRERLSYTEDKLRLGLIDFGATDRLAQQYALMHELTQVKARLIDEEGDRKIDIERSALSTLNDTFESLDRVDTELREFGNTGNLDAIEALLEERANLQLALRNHFDSEKVKERLGFAGQGNEVLDTSYDLVKERVYRTARRAVHWHTFLDTQLAKKERSISRARRWFMVKEAGEGALTAGGFALLGSLIGEMFGGKTTVETAVENNSPDVPSAVPSQDEMLQPVPQAVEESAREAVSAARESLVHEVRPGETLTSIMRAQLGGETDRFIAELKGFIARGDISMKDVLDAGIKSGNIDRIIPGESIDVSKLQALVDSVKK